ncbi:hypothetical protein NSP_19530 [Nodularia spumigena CCY9414]|nr:hypothetical protein NSP_19530 [Nodularia spumigena CCY9414]
MLYPKIKNAPEYSLGLNQGASTIHLYEKYRVNPELTQKNPQKYLLRIYIDGKLRK